MSVPVDTRVTPSSAQEEVLRLQARVEALEDERRRLIALLEILRDVTGAANYTDIHKYFTLLLHSKRRDWFEPWTRQLRPPGPGQVRNDTGMQIARGAVATTKGARYTLRDARFQRA